MEFVIRLLKSRKPSFGARWREGAKRRRHTFKVPNEKLARLAFGEFQLKHARGLLAIATEPGLTLGDCLESYLEAKRADCVKAHVGSLEDGARIIKEALGEGTAAQSLNDRAIARLKTALRARGNTPATINKRLALLKGAVRKAYEAGRIASDPLKGIEKVSDARKPVWRFLDEAEIERLLEACGPGVKVNIKGSRRGAAYERRTLQTKGLHDLLVFLLNTGARRGEALALEWRDLDFERELIRLLTTKRAAKGRQATPRYIPMNAALRELLEGMGRGLPGERVFALSALNLRRAFAAVCKRAGLGHVRLHDCRHSFASHLVMNGAPLNVVQELLGHSTLAMTLRYSHLAPAAKTTAVEGLNFGAAKGGACVLPVVESGGRK